MSQDPDDEKTQVAVAKVFERLKKEAQIDNFLTNTSTRGIQPTAATSEGREPRLERRLPHPRQAIGTATAPPTRPTANSDGTSARASYAETAGAGQIPIHRFRPTTDRSAKSDSNRRIVLSDLSGT